MEKEEIEKLIPINSDLFTSDYMCHSDERSEEESGWTDALVLNDSSVVSPSEVQFLYFLRNHKISNFKSVME